MTKTEARRLAHSRIAALPLVQKRAASEAIAARLWSTPEIANARTILLFASTPDEVDTDPIADEAVRRGIQIAYPRCLLGPGEMILHAVGSPGELLTGGRYGLREPAPVCDPIPAERVEVALVPGLAWDRSGMRLGRGAGYYDRLLARPDWTALTCGIFFADQEIPNLPADPWDRPLDAIFTELETLRVSP